MTHLDVRWDDQFFRPWCGRRGETHTTFTPRHVTCAKRVKLIVHYVYKCLPSQGECTGADVERALLQLVEDAGIFQDRPELQRKVSILGLPVMLV